MAESGDDDRLVEMAREMEIPLYRRYSESQAAQLLDISPATLKRIRTGGKIPYIRVSERKLAYFGFQLLEYLLENVSSPSTRTEPSKSATTGSPDEEIAAPGVEPGSTKQLDKQSALASARRILKKPKKP